MHSYINITYNHTYPNLEYSTDTRVWWHKCDGSIIDPPSALEGQKTPDLDCEERFLRGGPDNLVLSMEEDQLQDHEHIFHDPGHTHVYDYKWVGGPSDGHSGPGHNYD